jgi:hypothetical protein
VYAFGLGGAGQLGTRTVRSSATPQVVLGPWSSPGGAPVVKDGVHNEHGGNCIVRRIFSGGDHCFVTVTHKMVSSGSTLHLNLQSSLSDWKPSFYLYWLVHYMSLSTRIIF